MAIEMNPNNRHIVTGQDKSTTKTEQNQQSNVAGQSSDTPEKQRAVGNVELTSQVTQLKAIEASLNKIPAVDKSRVASIKAAIANGSFRIDSDKVADALLVKEFPEEFSK